MQSGTASSLTAPRAAASCAPNEPVSSQFGRREGRRKERERKKTPKVSEVEEERERRSERCSLGLNSAATKVPSTEKKKKFDSRC